MLFNLKKKHRKRLPEALQTIRHRLYREECLSVLRCSKVFAISLESAQPNSLYYATHKPQDFIDEDALFYRQPNKINITEILTTLDFTMRVSTTLPLARFIARGSRRLTPEEPWSWFVSKDRLKLTTTFRVMIKHTHTHKK